MNSCLFFDLDGVLLDSRRVMTASLNHVRASYQLQILSDKNITGYLGGDMNEVLDRSMAGIRDVFRPEAHERLRQYYLQHFADLAGVFAGVPTSLAELFSAGFVSIVLTDRPERLTRQVLAKYDLLHFIETVQEIHPGDDISSLLRNLLNEFRGDPEESSILSHSGARLEAGRDLGFYTAFPRYSFFTAPLQPVDLSAGTFADFAQEMILKKMRRLA